VVYFFLLPLLCNINHVHVPPPCYATVAASE
jgi:hypothetical protein